MYYKVEISKFIVQKIIAQVLVKELVLLHIFSFNIDIKVETTVLEINEVKEKVSEKVYL